MFTDLKTLKFFVPVCLVLILSGCGKAALNDDVKLSEGTESGSMSPLENRDITNIPFSESNKDEIILPPDEETPNQEELTIPELYNKLGEEIGFEYLGGIYYEAATDRYGIWLKQEAYNLREGRELTECELALEQAVKEGRLTIQVGKYSTAELLAFKDRVKPLFDDEGKKIYGTGLNETENKILVYVGVNVDLEALYKLVPEDAVSLQIMYGSFQIIDL